jgi:hypothetical protein
MRRMLLRVAALLAVALSACGGSASTTSSVAVTTTTAGGTDSTDSTDVTSTTAAGQPGVIALDTTFGPGTFTLTVPAAGLDGLASYRASLVVRFVGTEAGLPTEWSWTHSVAITESGREVSMESTGAEPESAWYLEIGPAGYERLSDGSCAGFPVVDDGFWDFLPAGALTGVVGAEEAGTEVLAGVATTHYAFDARALGLDVTTLAAATFAGEVWVADDGGFVVSYRLSIDAGEGYFGEGVFGAETWEYTLSGIGATEVVVPDDCPPGFIDAPVLPGAEDVVELPGYLAFSTTLTPAEVAAFYLDALPAQGWTVNSQVVGENNALLELSRGGLNLVLSVIDIDGVYRVDLTTAG